MKKNNKIDQIENQQSNARNQKNYLQIAFFLVSILFAWLYVHFLVGEDIDNGKTIGAKIMILYIIYAAILLAGYLLYKRLGWHLDQLWEKKKLLF